MRYNYIHYKDKKTGKRFVVSFCYTNREYSFAIQSLSDQHVKLRARSITDGRFNAGKTIKFGEDVNWIGIKNHFDMIRQNMKCWWFNKDSNSSLSEFKFPSHMYKAKMLQPIHTGA